MRRSRQLFVLLYAASGAAALVYEITWTRMLTLVLGHTVAAASTVLAAFMGGLATGSWLGGRLENELRDTQAHSKAVRLLRAYASLEIIIAISALTLPMLLAAFTPLLQWAYQDGLAPARFGLVRVALSIIALGVPTAAMGATFPIAVSWFSTAAGSSSGRQRSSTEFDGATDAGILYAANTAGAAIGALGAGLWLIPSLGVRATTWIGVALNAGAALAVLLLARAWQALPAAAVDNPDKQSRAANKSRTATRRKVGSSKERPVPRVTVACVAAAISGLVALVYEVAWTRLLVLVVGPTTYAFTIVVASFIIGIALGSSAAARLARRSSRPAAWLGAMLLTAGVAASIAGWFAASRLPLAVAAAVADPGASFDRIFFGQALTIVLLLLPLTCALGAAFPLAIATAGVARESIGRDLARVYAANTLGAIAGALTAGFVLLPAAGLPVTFRATAVFSLLTALGVWLAVGRLEWKTRGNLVAAASFTLGILTVFSLPGWDLELLSSGAYKYAPYIRGPAISRQRFDAGGSLSIRKARPAPSACDELAGTRSLAIDGKVDASNAGDMLTQRLLGLLPVLLHPNPQRVCIIGLGSGVTLGSALRTRHGTARRSSSRFRRRSSRRRTSSSVRTGAPSRIPASRADRRRRPVAPAADARQRYDVIVSEPSNPWMAGIASLFTREFFEAARAG